jgi:beta-lactam-binding protein with PASTA domain
MVGVHTFKQSPDRIYWEGEADSEGESLLEFLDGSIEGPEAEALSIQNPFGQFAERYIAEYSVSTGQSITQVFSQARTIQEADGLAAIVEDLPKEDTSTQQPTNSVVTIIRETVNRVSAPAVTQQAAQRARTCTVPRLRGRKRLSAERALVRAGCAVGTVKRVKSKKYKTGRIAKQSRAAGSIVAAGTRVNLSVARRVRR